MATVLPTVDTVVSPNPGPCVAILGGVHGDEYEGVLAANRLRAELGGELVCGEVRIAAPAHPAAWAACTRTSPTDGLNLARVFPGRPDGTATEQVAHVLTERAIRGADLVIDLHSAGSGFDMPLLCGYHWSDDAPSATSRRCAQAFAAPFTWEHTGPPAPGRSLTAAHQLGIPAIYVEGRGGLGVRAGELNAYCDGVRRALHLLAMLDTAPPATHRPVSVRGDGNTDAGIVAPADGYLTVHCEVGAHVRPGDAIATVVDPKAAPVAPITAPWEGFVMLLRRDARVTEGDTVCIVAAAGDELR